MPRKKATETENINLENEQVENSILEPEITEENESVIPDSEDMSGEVPETTDDNIEENGSDVELSEETDMSEQNDTIQDVNAAENTNEEEHDSVSENTENRLNLGVLKVRLDEDEQPEDDKFETLWNELVTFHRTRRIVPVIVTGIERTQLTGNVVVTYYKDQRILVPMTEMMINLSEEKGRGYTLSERLERVCNTMLGAEIDVMIKGMDKKNGSIVASRQDAMLRKREKFYLTPLSDGLPQVREGRIVEARIIGVTQLVARIEIFGVETTLGASELSWDWLPNVSDKFHVGDKLNVLIKELKGDSVDNLRIVADVKSITVNTSMENLSKCSVQNKYIGEITNVRNGVAYLRLKVGVNAIAHTNYDRRTPAKGDVVSFVITRINPEYGNVAGIITKIIKQSV